MGEGNKLILGPALYDKVKYLALIVLPGIGSLYFGIAQIWGLPYGEEVVGTIVVVDTFLGGLVGISAKNFADSDFFHSGFLTQTGVDPDTGNPDLALTLTKLPAELLDKKTVTFKVGNPPPNIGPTEVAPPQG